MNRSPFSFYAAGVAAILALLPWASNIPAVATSGADEEFTATYHLPVLCTIPEPPSYDFGDVVVNRSASWTFRLINGGSGVLNWAITDDADWITVAPASGSTAPTSCITAPKGVTITVSVNTTGLTPDQRHLGHVTITSNGGTLGGTIAVTVRQFPYPLEDVNQDNAIDIGDLAIVVANFGLPPFAERRADVTGDRVVDILDLARVARVFQRP